MGLYKVHITDMVLAYYWYVVLPVEIMGDKPLPNRNQN